MSPPASRPPPNALPDPRRSFSSASRELLARPGLADKVRNATGHTITALARASAEEPRWSHLKDHAGAIKRHTLTHLEKYLDEYTAAVEARGGHVHHAATAAEARELVVDLARLAGCTRAVKAKSMTSEELELNPALEAAGIEVLETDVGELILQLGNDKPSHITAPAIHLSADDVDAIYRHAGLATAPPPPATFLERATFLSLEARRHLRRPFLSADLGISGANLLVAERGALVLVENEGNIRLTTTLPRVHIVIAGIEKLIPTLSDAGVILSVLAPSATGQRQSSYVSVIEGPLATDREFHVVLIDAGRRKLLEDPQLYDALACIRCGACMNHCPVYRQVGGHAYGHEIPGPIGKILLPQLHPQSRVVKQLPFTSSLCGACGDVCPVRIPIPQHLITLRERAVAAGDGSALEGFAFRRWARWMSSVDGYARFRRMVRSTVRLRALTQWLPPISAWVAERALPDLPAETFKEWWQKRAGAPSTTATEFVARRSGAGAKPLAAPVMPRPVAHPGLVTAPAASAGASVAELWALFTLRLSELAGDQDAIEVASEEELLDVLRKFAAGVDPTAVLLAGEELEPVREFELGVASAIAGCAASATLVLDPGSARAGFASLLCRHSVILLPRDRLVSDVLAFYQGGRAAGRSGYLVQVTGASRTADIEKTLVSPAHGPARLTVVLTPAGCVVPGRGLVLT